MNVLDLTEKVLARRDLEPSQMGFMIEQMTNGQMPPSQIGFFLAALQAKGESVGELTGAAQALRRHAVYIDTGARWAVDTCGTGGDGADTFNISTTSAFIAAGAGVTIAKHGGRGVSSRCGSADVLAACGFNLEASAVSMEYAIAQIGIGFLFAQKLHPAMGRIAPIRRELKLRTIFNMIGPLANPAGASGQVLGVFAAHLTETYARVLSQLGCRRALVVHGMDGLDEISCCAPTRVCELRDGQFKTFELMPELLIGERYAPSEIKGGDIAENARILQGVLDGSIGGAKQAVALMNAAAAIVAGAKADTLDAGLQQAKAALESGAALKKLNELVKASQ